MSEFFVPMMRDQYNCANDLLTTSSPHPFRLCQRMAWALYEHLNVGTATMAENTETNLYSVSKTVSILQNRFHCFRCWLK